MSNVAKRRRKLLLLASLPTYGVVRNLDAVTLQYNFFITILHFILLLYYVAFKTNALYYHSLLCSSVEFKTNAALCGFYKIRIRYISTVFFPII